MIPSKEAARAISFHRQDALVVSTSAALRDWNQVSERRELDIDLTDCMDRAPAVGLGLSLAQPERKVLVLDCDAHPAHRPGVPGNHWRVAAGKPGPLRI